MGIVTPALLLQLLKNSIYSIYGVVTMVKK